MVSPARGSSPCCGRKRSAMRRHRGQGLVTVIRLLTDGRFNASIKAAAGPERIVAKNVLLATGVCDIEPKLPNLDHAIR